MIGELRHNLVTLLTDESTHSMKITTIVDMELYSSAFWLNLIQLWQKYVSYGMFRPCLKSERNQWNGRRWSNEEDENAAPGCLISHFYLGGSCGWTNRSVTTQKLSEAAHRHANANKETHREGRQRSQTCYFGLDFKEKHASKQQHAGEEQLRKTFCSSQINVSLSQEVPRWGTAAFRDPESILAVIRVARFVVFPQHLNTVYIWSEK